MLRTGPGHLRVVDGIVAGSSLHFINRSVNQSTSLSLIALPRPRFRPSSFAHPDAAHGESLSLDPAPRQKTDTLVQASPVA
ncbi:hypothetical protein CGGC5_v009390 [Colletotrichum fructicola Nara gc5]|uniref:Uncharacterized protein n=1 Tax=Colletotrichum fructicola (strain Nara gc5) TaxID=1213859 RepID=A0A7J6J324_COLFN|nr:hypothetical protein CFRS1_v008163 [Colletotrichum fructicola]KAF4482991.1 hypothetical protein CGGC5_v009390 [Colletotrichum fructicola Nara gc5]